MGSKPISRRKILKDAALASIAGTLYFNMPVHVFGSENEKQKSRVVLIRNKNVMDKTGKNVAYRNVDLHKTETLMISYNNSDRS